MSADTLLEDSVAYNRIAWQRVLVCPQYQPTPCSVEAVPRRSWTLSPGFGAAPPKVLLNTSNFSHSITQK